MSEQLSFFEIFIKCYEMAVTLIASGFLLLVTVTLPVLFCDYRLF